VTPAVAVAKKAGIHYQLHEYSHDSQASSYGEEAAELLGLFPNQVFKTLVVSTGIKTDLVVAIVPVSHQLNLKAVAKSLGIKKVSMADPAAAEKATGYIVGGSSPLGQKKRLPFVVDDSVKNFETIYVSAGRRGLEIEIKPEDLIILCDAKVSAIKA